MSILERCALIALSIFALQPLTAAVPERSVSPSGQFVIYGADAPMRGIVSNAAEETKTNLLGILRQPDRWKTPIVINLQPRQANLPEIPPAALHFSQTGFGLKLQLDLIVTGDANAALIERELLRAILLEIIYRQKTNVSPGTVYVEPPDWLLDGALALMPGRDREPLLDALSISGKSIPVEQLLTQRPALLDSPARLMYRACALVFVKLLIDSDDGRIRLVHYIESLSNASNDPLADLKAQFPVLRGNLKEIWSTNLASLASAQGYELLSFSETNRRLDLFLSLKIAGPENAGKTVTLNDLAGKKISPAEKIILDRLNQQLLLLATRAHPITRPIVREYQQVVGLLARGKGRELARRLESIEATRATLLTRMSNIDDYMNWFEATQSKTQSGMFADYLKSAADPQNMVRRRRDALSVYLDSIESQF